MLETGQKSPLDLHGEVEAVTFSSQDSGWTVLKVRDVESNEKITVVGTLTSVHVGERFRFEGSWTRHKTFGRQFKFNRATLERPTSKKGIIRYLSSGVIEGIGPKTAERIVEKFGNETISVLDNNPEKLYEVKLLGKKKIEKIIETWQEKRASVDVLMFLADHDISPGFAARILSKYGKDSIEVIVENPYRLANDFTGIGFKKADVVARSIGIEANSPLRIVAGILFQLRQEEDRGHCYSTSTTLKSSLVETLSLPATELQATLDDCLVELIEQGRLISEVRGGENRYYSPDIYQSEGQIVESLAEIMDGGFSGSDLGSADYQLRINTWIDRYCEVSRINLTQQQRQAVESAASSKFFVLTGGPGVGKTTTANTIIKLFTAMGRKVMLAAPTGRAAQRMKEVSQVEAQTIHRLLEWSPAEGGFQRNDSKKLETQVLIVDEVSMLDVKLAAQLFSAIDPKTQVIFIGDVDQLPPVGAGVVLSDLIKSQRLSVLHLTEIFRQAKESNIVQAAHSINVGEDPSFENSSTSDCHFIETRNAMETQDVVKRLVSQDLKEAGYEQASEVQVLSPMNKGELGTQRLNEELQELLNPKSDDKREFKRGNVLFRPGDKVIQVVNNYDLGVFNGDIGVVTHTNVEGGGQVIEYGDRVVKYDGEAIGDVRLAYAITIHKSQGSEFPVVVIPLDMQHFMLLQRNLIYTGLTRAKQLAIFVGARKALKHAIGNLASQERRTSLVEKMIEKLG